MVESVSDTVPASAGPVVPVPVARVCSDLLEVLAALRNLAISAFRLAGRTGITEATRWAARRMDRPFTIPGLTT